MTRIVALLCLAFSLAACSVGKTEAPQWRLSPAPQMAAADHAILVIAPGSPGDIAKRTSVIEEAYGVELVAEWPLDTINVHCLIIRARPGVSLETVMEEMEGDGSIQSAQMMQEFQTLSSPVSDSELVALQTGLHQIGALEAHQVATGRDVLVGILDTGIDFSHPDLASRADRMKDFVGSEPDAYPAEVHGTAMAGIVGAKGQDNRGIIGVAPDATLLGLRGCWQDPATGVGQCNTFSLARAVDFAARNGVQVLNMSLGGPYDPLLGKLIETAVLNHGMIVVAAAGQGGEESFPASHEHVIAATQSLKAATEGSVPAPGVDILSTAPEGEYDFFSGSSVAAAHIAGIAALTLEAKQSVGPGDFEAALIQATAENGDRANPNACVLISRITQNKNLVC